MHGSLVTSSLVRETTRRVQNYGFKFGQEKRPTTSWLPTVTSVA